MEKRVSELSHAHDFCASQSGAGEKATWRVIGLTAAMMVMEILAGWAFGSMALLADGWHMASHAGALGITAFAYAFARRHADNPDFSFGTGKVNALGGFTSAVVLAMVALLMAWESAWRLVEPEPIGFNQAIAVAVLGLLVNLLSVKLLGHGGHCHGHHGHDHDDQGPAHDHHGHGHGHAREAAQQGHYDHNLRAAYMHVLADVLTSLTAILALLTGKYFGWVWMDPLMGIVGSVVIARWAYGLLRDSGSVLLDHTRDEYLPAHIRALVEGEPDTRITDLHLWRVGPHHLSLLLSVAAREPRDPEHYKALLAGVPDLFHLSVEVNRAG